MARDLISEHDLLDLGIRRLKDLLGDDWHVKQREVAADEPRNEVVDDDADWPDMIIDIGEPQGRYASVLVEAKTSLSPANARDVIAPKIRIMRQLRGEAAVLIVAPWLSPRTRAELEARGIGYLDLTGNVSFRLSRPALVLRLSGAQHDPNPAPPGTRSFAGPRAGRLVRYLVDFLPPYRATQLSESAHISLPYVSRLLDLMTEQALIVREGRVVVDVDWMALIRSRAADVPLLKANSYVGALANRGIKHTLQALGEDRHVAGRTALTGSAATSAVAPLTAGGQLMLYVPSNPLHAPDTVARELGLIRVDELNDADVLLLRAGDDVVFERTRSMAGVRHVALSQLALDSLGGTGRMPEEGEAVLSYMAETESQWRRKSNQS